MTLRARLTAAFLAIVLGPVLLGAVLFGGAVATFSDDRVRERLDLAVTGVRTALGALCQQLYAAAQATAIVTDGGRLPDRARYVVQRGLADLVWLDVPPGTAAPAPHPAPDTSPALDAPPTPWADCADGRLRFDPPSNAQPPASGAQPPVVGAPPPGGGIAADGGGRPAGGGADRAGGGRPPDADPVGDRHPAAVGARAELRDPAGRLIGYAHAALRLDRKLIDRLVTAGRAAVTVLSAGGVAGLSTERPQDLDEVLGEAPGLTPGASGRTGAGRYFQRVPAAAGEPLTLLVSVGGPGAGGTYPMLIILVLAVAGLAVVLAWWLARGTTRPLTELAVAVDQVAAGNLAARVPVSSMDEVGRLAVTFNRMTREMQDYVHALTASRDQLRGNLALIGDTLSSTHDLGRILRVILQTALASTGAQAGIVLLLDQETGLLVGQCGEGLAERGPGGRVIDPQRLRLALGEGVLGRVASTGEPCRGRVGRDRLRLAADEPRCRTFVAVPLATPPDATAPVATATATAAGSAPPLPPGGLATDGPLDGLATGGSGREGSPAELDALALADGVPGAGFLFDRPPPAGGVLALYDRHGWDDFDDADLVTLRTFAGQAAVAVRNVWVHREVQRLSLTDPLTGLFNYRYLREAIRREVERANRFGRKLAVLALDLDRFKDVNDTYGHAAGDAVLAEFARRVRAVIREVDFAFRHGGEEFMVLLPETDVAGSLVVAERLRTVVRGTPVPVVRGAGEQPIDIMVTVSIGIAVFPDHAGSDSAVLRAADDALYTAKSAGRDRYEVSSASTGSQSAHVPAPRDRPHDGASAGPQPPWPSHDG